VTPSNPRVSTVIERPAERPAEVAPLREDRPDKDRREVSEFVVSEFIVGKLWLLWSRRRFLGKVVAYGIAGSLLLAFIIPARYQSVTRLMPPDQASGKSVMLSMLGAASEGLSGLTQGLGGVEKTPGDLFIGVLESRTVQDDLISKFDLRRVYWRKRWADARQILAERSDISSDRKSGIISIAVSDHSPERAAAMAREYVNELNWVVSQMNTSAAHRERVFLEERLQQVKQDLESAEKEFGEFSSRNATLDIKEQGKSMVEAAAQIEGERIAAETELQGLRQIYSDNNVRVRSTQARINELQRQLQAMGGTSGMAAAPPGGAADAKAGYPTIRQLPLLGVHYADLLRRTKVQEAVFETLTREYELAKVEEAKELPSVKVLDPAEVPEQRSFPPRTLVVIAGTGFAFFLGIVFVLGPDAWNEIDPASPGKQLATEIWLQTRRAAGSYWARLFGKRSQSR
jgi:capsule polysaccharide export protein KpsE/RkpR